jgi:tRNA uracil 4-sulfurtransferase
VIDKATDVLVLRPLIYQDKQEIIDLARKIGVEDMAKTMPEYCGVISNKPTINANLNKVVLAEQQLDLLALEKLAMDALVLDIRTVEFQADQQISTVLNENTMDAKAIILDIRAPDEVDIKPLTGVSHQVQLLPFYKLANQFAQLDQTQQYYLYCDRGVMSRLQALLLAEQGYANVGVYRTEV